MIYWGHLNKFLSFPAIAVAAVTFYSFSWQLGYSILRGDQLLYFPALARVLDPSILSRDFMANFSPAVYAFWDEVLIFLMNLTGGDFYWAVFLFSIFIRFIYFYALYKIILYFTKDRPASLFILLIFVEGFVVYGTGMRTFGLRLVGRDVGMAFGLMSLALILDRKAILSALTLGFGFLMHPSTVLPFFAVFYLAPLFLAGDKKEVFRTLRFPFLVHAVFAAAFLYLSPLGNTAKPFLVDPAWFSVLMERVSVIFISTWYYPNSSPLYAAASVYFFLLLLKEWPYVYTTERKYLRLLFFVPLGFAVAALLLSDLLRITPFMQLQMPRALALWKIILNPLFVYYGVRYMRDNPRDFLYNFSLAGIAVSFFLSEKLMFIFLPLQIFIWLSRNVFPRFWESLRSGIGYRIARWLIFILPVPVLIYFARLHNTGNFFDFIIFAPALALIPALLLFFASEMFRKLSAHQKTTDLPVDGRWSSVRDSAPRASLRALLWKPGYYGLARGASFYLPPLVVLLLALGFIGLKGLSIYPAELKDAKFMEACLWVKEHTPGDSLFIVEPFGETSGALRFLCSRSVWVAKKDGGVGMFQRDFALEWKKRYDLAAQLKKDSSLLSKVADEYGLDYIFSEEKLNIGRSIVFDNGKYFIYQL